MSQVTPEELKHVIEPRRGGTATHVRSVPVREQFEGQTIWNETVHVFDLMSHPKAIRAHARSYERPDDKQRFFATLHVPPIAGSREAVRTSIVAEAKQDEGEVDK